MIGLKNNIYEIMVIISINDVYISHDMQVINSGIIWNCILLFSQMNKCCFSVITLWHYFACSKLNCGPNFFHCLCSCDTNTFGSHIVLNSVIGLSISLLTCEFDPTILIINDGVCCLYSKNYVSKESKAFPNIDIIILFKTLVLK
jgi:hypothetical protein